MIYAGAGLSLLGSAGDVALEYSCSRPGDTTGAFAVSPSTAGALQRYRAGERSAS